MTGNSQGKSQAVLEAAEDLARAENPKSLWKALHRHLARFGVSGCVYGTEPFTRMDSFPNYFLNSIHEQWLNDKISQDLFICDEFVRIGRTRRDPVLWAAAADIPDITPDGWRSLGIDLDHGVSTGVTIPMPFSRGYGTSSIGLHAEGMSFAEFDAIWRENGGEIAAIVNTFDVTLRGGHGAEVFSLTTVERDYLRHLADGLRPQRVAERMALSEKQAFRLLDKTRRKLNATTTAQALAIAFTYSLIDA